jgi:SET domain-containing protein
VLSPKIEKRSSKIKGLGLFAKEKIHKGEIVWSLTPETVKTILVSEFDKLSKQEQQVWIDHCYQMGERFYMDVDDARLMNHSCEPNIIDNPSDGAATLVAARDIQKDEELTWNYLPYMNPYQVFPCCCGSKNCVGTVRKGAVVFKSN